MVKGNRKDIKNLINNQNFLVQEPKKGEPLTPCMYVYKAKIQPDRSLDKLKLIIVVKGDIKKRNYFEILGHQRPP